MKKLATLLVITLTLVFMLQVAVPSIANAGADAGAAAVISIVVPGGGEWYNGNFKKPFPWGECIAGYICFCFRFSSVLDAASGDTSEALRIDFWSAPAPN